MALVFFAVVFVAVVFFALACFVGVDRPVVFLPEEADFFAVLDVFVPIDLLAVVFLVGVADFLPAGLLVLVLATALVPAFLAVCFAAFCFAVVFLAVAVFAAVVFFALVDLLGAAFFAPVVRVEVAVLFVLFVVAGLLVVPDLLVVPGLLVVPVLFGTDADFVDRAERAGAAPRAAVVTKRRARPIRPPVVMDTSLRTVLIARARAANIRIRRVAAPLSTPPVVTKPGAKRPGHGKRRCAVATIGSCIDEDK